MGFFKPKPARNQNTPASGGTQRMTCPICKGKRIVPSDRMGAGPTDTEPCGTCDMDGKIDGPPS